MTIEISDSAYATLKVIADILQVEVGSLLDAPCGDGFFKDYYEDEIQEAKKRQGFVPEEEFWEELRQERKLER